MAGFSISNKNSGRSRSMGAQLLSAQVDPRFKRSQWLVLARNLMLNAEL